MKNKKAFTDATVTGTQAGSIQLRLFGAHLLTEYFTDSLFMESVNAIVEKYKVSTDPEEVAADVLLFAFSDALREYAIRFLKDLYGDENVNEFDYTIYGEEE